MSKIHILPLYWDYDYLVEQYYKAMNNWHVEEKPNNWFETAKFYHSIILYRQGEIDFSRIKFFKTKSY